MIDIALAGYGLAALLYGLLGLLLLTTWRKPGANGKLVSAIWLSALWAAVLAAQAVSSVLPLNLVWAVESLRPAIWLAFLFSLLRPLTEGNERYLRLLNFMRLSSLLLLLLMLGSLLLDEMRPLSMHWMGMQWRLIAHLLFAVGGLILVEQLFRNSPLEHRWTVKYLCFGLGAIFAYDFYLYTDALLFQRLDAAIWAARGGVNALMVPLIGLSLARNPSLQLELFVSRRMVFHTTALLSAGVYMLVMALTGYYIQLWGGEWGAALQIVFLFAALVLLLAMLFSGQLRARTKVFFNKHFFRYRYDYREEWLRLIGTLSGRDSSTRLPERVIWAMGEIVESPGGLLWTRDGDGYRCTATFGYAGAGFARLAADDPVVTFMQARRWVINLAEHAREPGRYDGLVLPQWLAAIDAAWLLVPLLHDDQLQGFVVLLRPRSPQQLNYENLDLLKTAGLQAASYLALAEAAEALAEARQFEGFNRLSAFVLHDLKNLIAQLSLVARNAERHKHNPAFVEDAVKTIENAVAKMNRLMVQLKSAEGAQFLGTPVELAGLLRELVAARGAGRPAPVLGPLQAPAWVLAEPDRLAAVIGHVVQNAQDATSPEGLVEVGLRLQGDQAIVDVRDTGSGMDKAFVEKRLFRPFDSTKGLTGMGIGAYECREFVRALGGQVEVDSEPGKGTLFRIVIPLAPPELDSRLAAEAG